MMQMGGHRLPLLGTWVAPEQKKKKKKQYLDTKRVLADQLCLQ